MNRGKTCEGQDKGFPERVFHLGTPSWCDPTSAPSPIPKSPVPKHLTSYGSGTLAALSLFDAVIEAREFARAGTMPVRGVVPSLSPIPKVPPRICPPEPSLAPRVYPDKMRRPTSRKVNIGQRVKEPEPRE